MISAAPRKSNVTTCKYWG